MISLRHAFLLAAALCGGAPADGSASEVPVEIIISVPAQKMAVLRAGGLYRKYKVSTSRFGLGDSYGSYKTPLGRLRVWEKCGGDLPSGAVLKSREATGEILPVNAPGRDPIVSRILWLEGLDPQNEHARGRGIYIHGTTEESKIGQPVSWGCIRMRSAEVIELFALAPVGSAVTIIDEALPHFPPWKGSSGILVASGEKPGFSVKNHRFDREAVSSLGELLHPGEERAARVGTSTKAALKGSILFAGVAAPKPPPKPSAPAPEVAPIPGALDGFFLRTLPPIGLLDLRRAALSSLLPDPGMFDAPEPAAVAQYQSFGTASYAD